jgi:hypothetical protein
MKFSIAAFLLGAAKASEISDPVLEESQLLETECQDYQNYDEETLLAYQPEEFDEVELEDGEEHKGNGNHVSSTAQKHFGKSWNKINAENHHILTTQAKCLRFVKKHPGHLKVCTWCKNSKIPKILWKWDYTLKVWYRFSHYDKKWHYWGPSKKGFTSVGWSYYRGYWHHGGFAYKYYNGQWWRYVNRKWEKYAKTVPVTPKPPAVRKECRAFYLRMKAGFSASLAEKKLPRCKVGKEVFQWRGEADCRFIGGKLAYITRHTCKSRHSNDQWKRVIRCVREPRATGKGLFSKGLK